MISLRIMFNQAKIRYQTSNRFLELARVYYNRMVKDYCFQRYSPIATNINKKKHT